MVKIQPHNPGPGGEISLSKTVLDNSQLEIGDDMKIQSDPNKPHRIILDKRGD